MYLMPSTSKKGCPMGNTNSQNFHEECIWFSRNKFEKVKFLRSRHYKLLKWTKKYAQWWPKDLY